MRKSSSKGLLAVVTVAALGAAGLTAIAPAASGQPSPHTVRVQSRVHWAHGKALGAASGRGPAATVRGYLAGQGLGRGTAASLRTTSTWQVRGITFLRMQQYAGGLRVVDGGAKAALDRRGRVISVIENTTRAGIPAAAHVTAATAREA